MNAEKPGYLFSLVADLGSGMQLQAQTNLQVGADRPAIDAELDKLGAAFGRQRARAAVPAMIQDLKRKQAQLEATSEDVIRLDAAAEGRKLSNADAAARDNARISLKRMQDEVERTTDLLEQTISEAE